MFKIEDIADSLKNEVILLNLKWAIYKNLFQDQNRSSLLVETSPILFSILQKLLLDDIAITLCRITDPAESGKHQNNTLYQLLSQKKADQSHLNEVAKKLEPIRNLRNTFIAHRGLNETLSHFLDSTSDGTTTLNLNFPMPLNDAEKIIKEINRIMNTTTGQYVLYEVVQTPYGPDGGARSLIDHLKIASFYEHLEKIKKLDSCAFYDEWQHFKHKNA
jgi:hypothetical protein